MKKSQMIRGLMAKKQMPMAPSPIPPVVQGMPQMGLYQGGKIPHFQYGGQVQPYAPTSIPGQVSALTTNPSAANVGLAAPSGVIGGQQFQQNVIPPGLGQALGAGALQGAGSQTALSNMLMNQAQGQGPNPAQNMLNQATGTNVANQAALMASVRGSNANPALIARQAAQQGAATQQQAAGQAATLGAQQQIAAESQLQLLAQQQQAAQQAANAQNIAQQGQINAGNAGLAGQAQAARAGALGGAYQGAGVQQAINSQGKGQQQPSNQASTPLSVPGGGGGIASGGGGASPAAVTGTTVGSMDLINSGGYGGGDEESDAAGGVVGMGPRSSIAMHLARMAKGGMVPAKVSPGEIYLSPEKAKAVAKGKASPKVGEKIPGKAKVGGDSLKNDIVDKTLKAGGVVVPRTQAQDYDKAAAFVRAVMAKHKVR